MRERRRGALSSSWGQTGLIGRGLTSGRMPFPTRPVAEHAVASTYFRLLHHEKSGHAENRRGALGTQSVGTEPNR